LQATGQLAQVFQ